jgi:L-seryl-tRNA(Ser) seleniumtransferase
VSDAPYRGLPSVDRVVRHPLVAVLAQNYLRSAVVALVRDELQRARVAIAAGGALPSDDDLARRVVDTVRREWETHPRRIINATGVILHTNAGRAPLGAEALRAVAQVAAYSDLEFHLDSGERGSRQDHVIPKLRAITGAEAAHVTVNAASAVLLALATHARGREVIVARGQSVEIGGGFRVPVILRQSGARLVEVGTTNRTRLSDYEEAITPRTIAILHVHAGNFRLVGFTESVPLPHLAALASSRGILLVADNGSGALLDTEEFGLAHEPTVTEALDAGCDLIAFSGDKLLGGPQSGVILGKKVLIDAIAKHPLARAVRPDKMTLAALSATLSAYLRGDAVRTLPVWRAIAQSPEVLRDRAEAWSRSAASHGLTVGCEPGESTVGGGSLPGETQPTTLIRLPRAISATALRQAGVPVLARTNRGHTLLDLRAVSPEEEGDLLRAVLQVAGVMS